MGEWEIGELNEAWSLRNLHNARRSPIYRSVENCLLILCNAAGELHTNKGQIYQIRALMMHLRFLNYCDVYNEHWGLLTRQSEFLNSRCNCRQLHRFLLFELPYQVALIFGLIRHCKHTKWIVSSVCQSRSSNQLHRADLFSRENSRLSIPKFLTFYRNLKLILIIATL